MAAVGAFGEGSLAVLCHAFMNLRVGLKRLLVVSSRSFSVSVGSRHSYCSRRMNVIIVVVVVVVLIIV